MKRSWLSVAAAAALLVSCSSDSSNQLPEGTRIVIAALNTGFTGNLGGIDEADALCQAQADALGRKETFKAFLSAKGRNLRELVRTQMAAVAAVVNVRNQTIASNWLTLIGGDQWRSSRQILTFEGKPISTDPGSGWDENFAWHGSLASGAVAADATCNDWTDGSATLKGAAADLSDRRPVANGQQDCSKKLVVLCVGSRKTPEFGPCPTIGLSCTSQATDSCVRRATCNEEKRCVATSIRTCDDGLVCTEDKCTTLGLSCEYTPRSGWCVIGGQCYKDGERDSSGCQVCDSSLSPKAWVPAPTACRLGGKCYKVDERDATGCQICSGVSGWEPLPGPNCKIDGKCYTDKEEHPDGCALCDPSKTEAGWTLKPDKCLVSNKCYDKDAGDTTGCNLCKPSIATDRLSPATGTICKIAGKCYQPGDAHPDGCATCDPSVTSVAWTPKGNDCLINNKCYPPDAKDTSGCNSCQPNLSKTTWSPINTQICTISGKCYDKGAAHPQGCATCDPSVSSIAWTPSGNDCIINNVCYSPGTKDSSGCNSCDPTQSKTAWTPLTGSICTIAGRCYAAGQKNAGGCAECDPTVSSTAWTPKGNDCFINNTCYATGALDTIGCSKCDPTVSRTAWTPVPGCYKAVVIAALNNAHNGALGGVTGADQMCQNEATAAGQTGTWKAFLSDATRNAVDLITGADAALPLVNLRGQQISASWTAAFKSGTWNSTASYVYAFDGKAVNENTGASPDWYRARGWTGSDTTGRVVTGLTCTDWTSTSSSGRATELDLRYLVAQYSEPCSRTLAVICIKTAP